MTETIEEQQRYTKFLKNNETINEVIKEETENDTVDSVTEETIKTQTDILTTENNDSVGPTTGTNFSSGITNSAFAADTVEPYERQV